MKDFHLLSLLRGLLFIRISLSIMATNFQVMSAAQPMDMMIWMTHIIVEALLFVKVKMMEDATLVMVLNIVMVALSDSLLEVMAMPDSKS